jgi:hypothetical protein
MGETVSKSRMAEIIGEEIFSVFGWMNYGPPNQSWECVHKEQHGKNDHPTDATFIYQDPYSEHYVHLITDFKSYAAKSITETTIRDPLASLGLAVDCAKSNENWKKLYQKPGVATRINGLLFIYNHDGKYDKLFYDHLDRAFDAPPRLPNGVQLFVLGPEDIWYLNDIAHDIGQLKSKGIVPLDSKKISFYYPDASRERFAVRNLGLPASIEMLKGRYQILIYERKDSLQGVVVYYRGAGAKQNEFILLIDMLRSYQLLTSSSEIRIRAPFADPIASVNFDRAKIEYASHPEQDIPEKLQKVTFQTISNVTPKFSEYEIALGDKK